MPPELTSPVKGWRSAALIQRLPDDWHAPLGALLLGVCALIIVTRREWGEMLHQWWNIDTYNHILLIPLIAGWLVWLKLDDLKQMAPQPWSPGLALVAAGFALWVVGRGTEINLIAQAGAVGVVQGMIVTALGLRVSLVLALPLTMLAFLVPFGDEIIPQLQAITATIAVALTHWSGIPAVVDGIYIDTPVGMFIVAEACSGVKFLIAMVTLAVLVCFTRFDSWSRRAVFLIGSIVVPILANGVRAWGTIYIAQFQGVEFAAGFDHIFYGWIFFALVVAVILAGAWKFFEREPEDYGWSTQEVDGWLWVKRLEDLNSTPSACVSGTALLCLSAGVIGAIVAPPAMG